MNDRGRSKIKKSPKIILQSVEIPMRPTETHNPGCVKIWMEKQGFKVLKVLKSNSVEPV